MNVRSSMALFRMWMRARFASWMANQSILQAVIWDSLDIYQNLYILPDGDVFRRFEPAKSIHGGADCRGGINTTLLPVRAKGLYLSRHNCDEFKNLSFTRIAHFAQKLARELDECRPCVFTTASMSIRGPRQGSLFAWGKMEIHCHLFLFSFVNLFKTILLKNKNRTAWTNRGLTR